jgi:hypothetical protein
MSLQIKRHIQSPTLIYYQLVLNGSSKAWQQTCLLSYTVGYSQRRIMHGTIQVLALLGATRKAMIYPSVHQACQMLRIWVGYAG